MTYLCGKFFCPLSSAVMILPRAASVRAVPLQLDLAHDPMSIKCRRLRPPAICGEAVECGALSR